MNLIECATLGIVVGMLCILAFIRIIQGMLIQIRETGPLLSWQPDSPAMRRWQRGNSILFGTIASAGCFVIACHLLYAAWWSFANQVNLGRLYLCAAILNLVMSLGSGFVAWRAFRQRD